MLSHRPPSCQRQIVSWLCNLQILNLVRFGLGPAFIGAEVGTAHDPDDSSCCDRAWPASLAFAGPKVASDVPQSTASGMVDVIVQYKSFSELGTVNAAGLFGRIHRHFRSIPATHMTVPVSMISQTGIQPAGGLHLAEPHHHELAGYHRADRKRQHGVERRLGWNGHRCCRHRQRRGAQAGSRGGERYPISRSLQPKLRPGPRRFRSIWTWDARGGHRGRERSRNPWGRISLRPSRAWRPTPIS